MSTELSPTFNGIYDSAKPLPYKLTDADMDIQPAAVNVELGEKVYRHTVDRETLHYLTNFATLLNTSRYGTDDGKRPTISEPEFVKTWLPHLYNGNKGREGIDDSPTTAWTANIAKSPYNPVDVIRNGEVIFTVPPAIGRLNAVSGTQREMSIGMLHQDMANTLTRVPHALGPQLDYLLERSYIPRDKNVTEREFRSKLNLKYLFTMDEIFTYYGYPSILTDEIMSLKPYIMPTGNKNESNASGAVQTTPELPVQPVEDDDFLFG